MVLFLADLERSFLLSVSGPKNLSLVVKYRASYVASDIAAPIFPVGLSYLSIELNLIFLVLGPFSSGATIT